MGVKNRLCLPPELQFELVNALPFHVRWAINRVSRSFDYFLLDRQLDWLIKSVRRVRKFEKSDKEQGENFSIGYLKLVLLIILSIMF